MLSTDVVGQFRELLSEHLVFSILSDEEVERLVAGGELVQFQMGETFVREGEEADAAYLLYSGRVRVYRQIDGKPVTLATLPAGSLFGERALTSGEIRGASIRAAEDVVLLRIPRKAFQDIVDANDELARHMAKLEDQRSIHTFIKLSAIGSSLKPKQLTELLGRFEIEHFTPDETIFEEGAEGDRLFIVRKGEVKVVRHVDGEEQLLAHVGEGEYFGELALVDNAPRAATVVSTSETECLTLSGDHFRELLDAHPQIREEFEKARELYQLDAELEAKFGIRPAELTERRQLDYESDAGTTTDAEAEPEVGRKLKPKKGLFRKYPFLRQLDETDCGAACLAMISRCYGVRLSIGKLRDTANVGREGASLYSLSAAAEEIGYSSRPVNTDYDHLVNVALPAIAHWKGYHYIVLYEVTASGVLVGDPAIGLVRMSRKEFESGWTGRLLMLEATPKLLGQEQARTTFSRFLPYLKPFRWLMFEIFLASIVLEAFQLVSPIFTQLIVDKVLVHQNVNMLNLMLVGMVIVGVFQAAMGLLRQYLSVHLSQKLALRLSTDLLAQILKLPMRFFHTRKIGDVLQRFEDNGEIQEVLTGKVLSTVLDVMTIVFTLGLMLYYNAQLTLVALVAIPFYIALTLAFTPILKRNNIAAVEQSAANNSNLIETINSIATVKNCAAEDTARWNQENHFVKEANVGYRGQMIGMAMSGLSTSVQIFAGTFMLWYGAHLVISGKLTVGQLMAFQSLVGMVISPIMGLIGLWDELQEAFLALQRLSDIYDFEPEQQPGTSVKLPRLRGSVRFENVSFRYNHDDPNILSEVDFTVEPGMTVALVGRSGSGKTTLVNLLQRFYTPTDGRILVDDVDLATADVRTLRSQLGVVSQSPQAFSGTIRQNIAYADPDASTERVVAAAKIANAHDFIMGFPLGYATVIGEVGIQLSGGQMQRLSIARALITDPRILVFDEATSALDTESEKLIQQNITAILRDRTAFIIAHRLSTVQSADKILVLDQGIIVEEGTHRELLDKKGLYFFLNSQQLTM